ncbi:uncharacterized protein LOC132756301 isoform X3 [Ruditapes philippinarum]|uniref:uncharacterized protein LOC132756301 isoform X3 n=1 Tax=Ruditapes philippinarum TaxID=129788 RepID=UPI00295AD61E|nr:uncharacterized protein LOC132756301 isoform X3 [Ruditapes philippinarum]
MQQPSLTTVPRQYPVHPNINDDDGKDTNDAESRIQYYLEAYKHYIVQCINPEDLLFYEHFSIERRKYFRKLSSSSQDSIRVASKMIDTIISMKYVPGRFSALVKLFEVEFENEKISRILKGEKIPTNRKENKEKIQKVCSAEICKNLNVTEIIPHLLEEKMISVNEGTQLKNKAERETPFSAAIDLLLKLPHRHPNWYTRFLSCLVKSCHADLAKLVDEELCKKIIQDMPTREKEGNPPVDYRDDFMSCVSGSDSVHLKHRKEDGIKSKTSTTSVTLENETDLKDKTIYTETVVPTECSLENERITVAEWVIASQDMDVNSVRERRSTATNRPYSLICEKPFRKTRSKRHQTLQIPMNQMAIIQKYFLKEHQKATPVYHSYDEIPKDASFCSRSSSMFSSMDSLESMCVDLQMSVDEKEHSCVNLEFIGISKNTSDLNQNSSDGVQIIHEMEENTTTMDVETKSHLDCQRIDRAIQTEAKMKTSNCPKFQQLLTMSFLHPVKISLVVKDNPDIHNLCTILDWMSHRTIELEDYSLSIKAHYISTVIQAATEAEDIDVLINNLLTARESDGYFENQDFLIRDVIEKYEYKETEIFKTIFAELQLSDTGDGLSSLRILTQILQRNSTGDNNTDSANNNEIVKKDSGCYASEDFEKLNQFTDELSGNTLSLNKSCSRNENVTKLKDEMCNTNGNAIKENDRICQVTDLSDTTKESKWNGITKVKVGCDAKESDTMKSNTCKTCNNCMTNGEEKCCTERTRLKDEQETRKANNSFEETNDKTLNVCAATVVKEKYTDKSSVDQVDTNIGTKSNPCGCFIRDEADSISRSDVYLETMSPNSPDYKVIEEQKFKRCGVTIVCIHRISNQNMLSRFTRQKELLQENKGNANVQRLFHWSKHLKAVIEEGFGTVITEHGSEGNKHKVF